MTAPDLSARGLIPFKRLHRALLIDFGTGPGRAIIAFGHYHSRAGVLLNADI
jgi:hypothetical protein